MLPDLEVFIPNKTYWLGGKFLNRLCERIRRQTPLAGAGVDLEETAQGIAVHAQPVAAAAPSMSYGFQVSWDTVGAEVAVAGGYVAGPDWTDWIQGSPFPKDWLAEFSVAASTHAVADGDSVWLEIEWALEEPIITGQLWGANSTVYDVYSGAGGGGGQGGGGGGGGDLATAGTAGSAGADAAGDLEGTGGNAAGGAGGSPGEGDGEAGKGGAGGDGAAGGAGESVTFNHYELLRLQQRRYSVYAAAIVISTSKPSGNDTTTYARLASISGTTITQYHVGTFTMTPAVISFIP